MNILRKVDIIVVAKRKKYSLIVVSTGSGYHHGTELYVMDRKNKGVSLLEVDSDYGSCRDALQIKDFFKVLENVGGHRFNCWFSENSEKPTCYGALPRFTVEDIMSSI